ncbi:MAG TPA: PEP/pyruvate-binding domain-containing protein [Opitutaceae bacterium]|nr:PEP/pyruvate-binding domain-containing protein [Opitutaceae bacterium]
MSIRSIGTLGAAAAPSLVGGKAASLGRLVAWQLPVPDGFVMTVEAYEQQLARTGLLDQITPALRSGDWLAAEQIAARVFAAAALPHALQSEIETAWRKMGGPTVAVRSSATIEDAADASFAGQFDSFLDIQDFDALIAAVKSCWASLWNRRALEYRHQRGDALDTAKMAVVVQRQVAATAAGVIFTVDPLTQRRDRMLLEIAPGLGAALVSGEVRGESCTLERRGRKRRVVGLPPRLLTRRQLRELVRFASTVETKTGSPQDIEFAVAEGRLSLLQARPITTLGEPLPLPQPMSYVDRIVQPLTLERYAIAPRPLDTAVFVRMVSAAAYVAQQGGFEITPDDLAEFRRQLWHQQYRLPHNRMRLRALIHPLIAFRQLREDWLGWWLAGPRPLLEKLGAPTDLTAMDDTALFTRAATILNAWEEPTNRRFLAASSVNAETCLRLLVALAVGPRASARVTGQLLAGIASPSSEANADLWHLSRMARDEPETLAAIRADRWAEIPLGSPFATALRAFFYRFGHRESGGFYLSAPTWRHDPTPVHQLIRTLVEVTQRHESSDTAHRQARALVEHRLRWFPWLGRRFVALLERVRALHVFRETSHFDLTRPLDALQDIAAEIARRLRSRGLIAADDDVFYLTFEEAQEWLAHGPPTGLAPRDFIARRRATYRLVNARWQANRPRVRQRGKVLRGTAASPGRARATARIVRDETQFERLRPGEVLVCPRSNPSWTPLFLTASAVISETGGAASHAAIVAREYGLPAVLAVTGATELIEDGQLLEIDGGTGRVTLLPRAK